MGLSITQLIDAALVELQDPAATRWTRPELLGYFNAGQRTLVTIRPDQAVQNIDLILDAGWRQQLPANTVALIDISSNVGGMESRITKVKQWQLDAVEGNWRSKPPARVVQHYMHDVRAPNEFLVYPAVVAGVCVRAQVSVLVVDVVSESDDPSLPLLWMDALRHFVLYRAWSKDAEFGGNAQLAAAHLQLFNNALGQQAQTSNAVAPTV